MKLTPGLLISEGKYRLEQRFATGGMGSLWIAKHFLLDVRVAIKFMDPQSADSAIARQRFEREAKAAALLRGQHVVHVHDYGVEEDLPYIVMELLEGEDLGRRLNREKRLTVDAMSLILTQIAKGLRKAHEAGVVHRDLKPPNIFLARTEDGQEIVKVLDFGIAKDTTLMVSVAGSETKTGELMGSPHYMSPEQIRGRKDIDPRSDLWSLGVITFRALTGQLPFPGEVLGNVIAKILADPLPSATKIAPELPPEMDGFFNRAFARDRTQRFQSAREMAEAFAALSQDPGRSAAFWSSPALSVLPPAIAEAIASTRTPLPSPPPPDVSATLPATTTPAPRATSTLSAPSTQLFEGRVPSMPELYGITAPPPTPPLSEATSPLFPGVKGVPDAPGAEAPSTPTRYRSPALLRGAVVAVALLLLMAVFLIFRKRSPSAAQGYPASATLPASTPAPGPEPFPSGLPGSTMPSSAGGDGAANTPVAGTMATAGPTERPDSSTKSASASGSTGRGLSSKGSASATPKGAASVKKKSWGF